MPSNWKMKTLALFAPAALVLAACGQTASEPAPTAAPAILPSVTPAEEVQPTAVPSPLPPTPEATAGSTTASETAAPSPEPSPVLDLPLPLTPPQGEGPYYPIEKPADRDSDLIQVTGRAERAAGQPLQLGGRVLREDGTPLAGAMVEIWQTDGGGVYLHPGDPNFAQRDPNFQSYGEAPVGPDGSYEFLTLYPQLYGSRPRHIHVKIREGDRVLLTTQFYFTGDERLQSDGLVAQAGEEIQRLLVDLAEGEGESGERLLIGRIDVILPADG